MRLRVTSALWILALAFAEPLSAHHSVQAVFDIHKTITVTGTVAKVEWINPHSKSGLSSWAGRPLSAGPG